MVQLSSLFINFCLLSIYFVSGVALSDIMCNFAGQERMKLVETCIVRDRSNMQPCLYRWGFMRYKGMFSGIMQVSLILSLYLQLYCMLLYLCAAEPRACLLAPLDRVTLLYLFCPPKAVCLIGNRLAAGAASLPVSIGVPHPFARADMQG